MAFSSHKGKKISKRVLQYFEEHIREILEQCLEAYYIIEHTIICDSEFVDLFYYYFFLHIRISSDT